jgi:cytochrome P450
MGKSNRSNLPPGPKPILPLRLLFEFRRDSIRFLRKIANQFGDIVHFKIGMFRIVLLNHPDFIKEVLSTQHSNFIKGRPLKMTKELLGEGILTSEGEFHKRQSQIIQPAFHRKMIESYTIEMTNCISDLMNGWEEGMEVDIRHEMTRMSLAIAGKTLFSIDLDSEAPKIINALSTISNLFGRVTVPLSELLIKLPLPSTFRFYKAKAILDDTIYRMIEKRRLSKANHGDFLSLLLQP